MNSSATATALLRTIPTITASPIIQSATNGILSITPQSYMAAMISSAPTSVTISVVPTMTRVLSHPNCTDCNTTISSSSDAVGSGHDLLYITLGSTLSVIIVIGNVLVLLAFILNRSLKTVTNYFIISLAVADLIIGIVSVNFFTLYVVSNGWPLGPYACDAYLSLDFLASQGSVFGLVAICIDRYLSLSRPLKYRVKRTPTMAKMAVCMVWLCAFVVWVPWIVSYQFMVGKRTVPDNDCYVQFLSDNVALAYSAEIVSFEVANIVMVCLYIKIYLLIRKRSNEQSRERIQNSQKYTNNNAPNLGRRFVGKTRSLKTVKMIAMIIALNFFLWLPYHVMALIYTVDSSLLPPHFFNTAYYIAYSNSALNPICYAVMNPQFRKAILRLLCSTQDRRTRPQREKAERFRMLSSS